MNDKDSTHVSQVNAMAQNTSDAQLLLIYSWFEQKKLQLYNNLYGTISISLQMLKKLYISNSDIIRSM